MLQLPAKYLLRIAVMVAASLSLSACVTETTGPRQPAKPDLKEASRINTQLGLTYAGQGRFELAETKLKKAIEQDDGNAPAHAGLGFVYSQQNNVEDARSEYRRAISLDGDDPDIRNNYGVFLCSQGKYDEGDSNFALALKHRDYSTPAKAWTNAGVCARQAGDAARAEADFRRALQADPDFAGAMAELANVEFRKENYYGARAFLERYQKVAAPTPALLLLGFKTERALDNDDAANQYSLKLIRNYPDSDEAAQLLKLRAPPP
ncbi:MAG TPA: type IV pilus biogenesis/stability protein PilW [Nevskia sp.]|nr:type IV pilus biogenesis/stability protein PilW [Nevskia sp.]